ncbi:MAG: hypothetical protein QS98_C0008G0029 [archaeon GW2011_AR3]|nr:MAG: hypothetical protein QS98_C0008G0029 [archaeon GW2011_AR3]
MAKQLNELEELLDWGSEKSIAQLPSARAMVKLAETPLRMSKDGKYISDFINDLTAGLPSNYSKVEDLLRGYIKVAKELMEKKLRFEMLVPLFMDVAPSVDITNLSLKQPGKISAIVIVEYGKLLTPNQRGYISGR